MKNKIDQDKFDNTKHRKTYFWILLLAALGFLVGGWLLHILSLDKLPECPTSGCIDLIRYIPPFHPIILVSVLIGSAIGFYVESIKKSKTSIITRAIGYLIIFSTFLIYFLKLFIDIYSSAPPAGIITESIPLIIILCLSFLRKITPAK